MNLMEKYKAKMIASRDKDPVSNMPALKDRYSELCQWLKGYDVTGADIRENLPELYRDIQDTIQNLDTCMIADDLPGFSRAVNKLKDLYLQAVKQIERDTIQL